MKLSFIPADLHLIEKDGQFMVILQGNEVFRSPYLKKELEEQFPSQKPSPDEVAELLRKSIADSLVGHNSWRPEERNRKKINSTRTFG
jgi:hypothetical protein